MLPFICMCTCTLLYHIKTGLKIVFPFIHMSVWIAHTKALQTNGSTALRGFTLLQVNWMDMKQLMRYHSLHVPIQFSHMSPGFKVKLFILMTLFKVKVIISRTNVKMTKAYKSG